MYIIILYVFDLNDICSFSDFWDTLYIIAKNCYRPFIVQPVISSNLILIVINKLCPDVKEEMYRSPFPEEVDYNMSLDCYRALFNDFPRRHYMSCINRSIHVSKKYQLTSNIFYCRYIYVFLEVYTIFFQFKVSFSLYNFVNIIYLPFFVNNIWLYKFANVLYLPFFC